MASDIFVNTFHACGLSGLLDSFSQVCTGIEVSWMIVLGLSSYALTVIDKLCGHKSNTSELLSEKDQVDQLLGIFWADLKLPYLALKSRNTFFSLKFQITACVSNF